MNHELLAKAKEGLTINDVFIRRSAAFIADEFEPAYCAADFEPFLKYLHQVDRSEVIQLTNGEQEQEPQKIFRVFINVGTQWHLVEDTETHDPAAQVEATFVAEYLITQDLEQDALAEFALHNASYHIWPYWREFLMSQCSRMNLPKITLPTKQFASNIHINKK